MQVLLRADASATQGTGHVMRCLTLAHCLREAAHTVTLATNESGVVWLEDMIRANGIDLVRVPQHSLDHQLLSRFAPDWLVVDSYEIEADRISGCRSAARVLAIVDGDDRGIDADLFLDHNVGAELLAWPAHVQPRLLAGSRFALIRQSIVDARRPQPWKFLADSPHIVAVMGGSDPTGTIAPVTQALCGLAGSFRATIVCASSWRSEVDALVADRENFTVMEPTSELPAILATCDLAVSAAGTSSWEFCTLGIPSVLIDVVDNQTLGLSELSSRGLALAVSPAHRSSEEFVEALRTAVGGLLSDEQRRRAMSLRSLESFDGLGALRVVEAMNSGLQS
jgi:UDP-2,4-diacetamido-2,4,6-trideoxy-beta-L-altropyranose hydrolase